MELIGSHEGVKRLVFFELDYVIDKLVINFYVDNGINWLITN